MRTNLTFKGFGLLILSCFISSSQASNYVCKDVGRFQLPDNGNGYVDCVRNDAGELIVFKEMDCEDFPYSSYLQNCDFKHPTQGDFFELIDMFDLERNDSYDDECAGNTLPNLCFSCDMKIQCIGGAAYLEFCYEGETCAEDVNFGGGVCLPYNYAITITDACDCPRFGFTADGFNEQCYLFCDTSTNPPTIEFYKCPDGEIFEDGVCKVGSAFGCYEPEPVLPNCTEMGTFINQEECSYYYACIPDGSAGFKVKQYCCEDPRTFFDPETGKCENVCNLLAGSDKPDFICPGPGIFMDPYECDVYCNCASSGQLPYKRTRCPDGNFYNDDVHACGPDKPASCVEAFDYKDCPRIVEVAAEAGCSLPTTSIFEALLRYLF